MKMQERIEKALKSIEHPEIAYTLWELGMLEGIVVKEDKVLVTLKLPRVGVPIREQLIESIKSAVKNENVHIDVKISIKEMSDEERIRFMKMAQEAWKG